MTSTERSRKRRDELKKPENENLLLASREVDRGRKKKRQDMTTGDLLLLRERERKNTDAYRRRKKTEEAALQHDYPDGYPDGHPNVAYKRPQTLGKAVNKASDALPNSPGKRRIVVEELSKEFDELPDESTPHPSAQNKIPDEDQKLVKDFFCSDTISWQSPNKKDVHKNKITGKKT